MAETKPIRAGLHVVADVRCSCGGELRIERCGQGEWRWETFCDSCQSCDPNGWPTLRDAAQEAPGFFAKGA